jgi:predicted O-methyltransferase YrrM
VLFAGWGAEHVCVVGSEQEATALSAYLTERGIVPARPLSFVLGPSQDRLIRLELPDGLDLMLIDGCHGFPMPVVDWFYGARWLKQGGVLVVDDIDLPGVKVLTDFLDRDPRWVRLEPEGFGAYRRESEGDLAEEWTEQGFLA